MGKQVQESPRIEEKGMFSPRTARADNCRRSGNAIWPKAAASSPGRRSTHGSAIDVAPKRPPDESPDVCRLRRVAISRTTGYTGLSSDSGDWSRRPEHSRNL